MLLIHGCATLTDTCILINNIMFKEVHPIFIGLGIHSEQKLKQISIK